MMTVQQIEERLSNKCVGIAGVGGLGSRCAEALVRVGVGKMILVDFDVVNESNLNRQFFFTDQIGMKKVDALYDNLIRIRPYLALAIHHQRVTPQNVRLLFADCDVVVEAMDEAKEKEWFIREISLQYPNTPLVAASGISGWGNLGALKVVRHTNLIVCGDGSGEASDETPPIAARVGIVACMQADVVIELLLSK
ncbi:MAG: sulfur carrier protein ThiS adenylyltransferase ThiF [Prevotellaceae bacterium]|jgi:sulfur carrier protein ThiS adenylyltransferase|nr:sulfur carrier protein ThiS adenylyltransferase ThiF [Prevotellaceae bacterium]